MSKLDMMVGYEMNFYEKKFEENLNTFVGKVDAALQTYDEAIKNEFNSVFQNWIEFQNKHVS